MDLKQGELTDDINFYSNKLQTIDASNEVDVNIRINDVVNIHTKIVGYLLVKYFKLLSDLLSSIMNEEEKESYKFTLSLPTMLELGTTEPYVIQMISAGITRSAALKLFAEFQKLPNYKDLNIFDWLQIESNLFNIDKIYIRYLKKLNFIKNTSTEIE